VNCIFTKHAILFVRFLLPLLFVERSYAPAAARPAAAVLFFLLSITSTSKALNLATARKTWPTCG
jgi:hypothetical protein